MIITQTFKIARWQIVVKKSEATKQTKDQNNNKNKLTTVVVLTLYLHNELKTLNWFTPLLFLMQESFWR